MYEPFLLVETLKRLVINARGDVAPTAVLSGHALETLAALHRLTSQQAA